MKTKTEHFIEAIRAADSSAEVLELWTEAAKGEDITMKDIISIHQATHRILLEAVYEKHPTGKDASSGS